MPTSTQSLRDVRDHLSEVIDFVTTELLDNPQRVGKPRDVVALRAAMVERVLGSSSTCCVGSFDHGSPTSRC